MTMYPSGEMGVVNAMAAGPMGYIEVKWTTEDGKQVVVRVYTAGKSLKKIKQELKEQIEMLEETVGKPAKPKPSSDDKKK